MFFAERMIPLSGFRLPINRRNSVVFPIPLGPTRPTLSPRDIRTEKSFIMAFPSKDFPIFTASKTNLLYSFSVLRITLILPIRRLSCFLSSRILRKFLSRPWFRLRRALIPSRDQRSSSSIFLSYRARSASSCR